TLDRLMPERPLVLLAIDGHSAWGNSAALRQAGIATDVADPAGGTVDRDAAGNPTGIFIETAATLLRRAIPRRREPAQDLAQAVRRAHALGITGAHDFDRTDIWSAAQELSGRDRLPFRLVLSVPMAKLDAARDLELRSRWG